MSFDLHIVTSMCMWNAMLFKEIMHIGPFMWNGTWKVSYRVEGSADLPEIPSAYPSAGFTVSASAAPKTSSPAGIIIGTCLQDL